MSATRQHIYIADTSAALLDIIAGKHSDDIELNASSAVNLAIQFMLLTVEETGLCFEPNELLFCCDILNGGAQLTEFKAPDSVSIKSALDSMKFGLMDAASANYGNEVEKWGISARQFINRLSTMASDELIVVALATRQFWSNKSFSRFKTVKDCGDYQTWAKQYCDY